MAPIRILHRRRARPGAARAPAASPRRARLVLALCVLAGFGGAGRAGAQVGRAEPLSFVRAIAQRPALRAVAGEPLVRIDVETPADGALIGDPAGLAFVSGRVLARFGGNEAFDIMFVIDRSESTTRASGTDVNGDGIADARTCGNVPSGLGMLAILGGACRPTPDSILAAELSAVRALLRQLDPRRTRVGVVAFSGDRDPDSPDATVVAGLTSDYRAVEKALTVIGAMGSRGRTNIEAAIDVAASALLASRSAYSSLGVPIEQVMLFLSDGVPTLPVEESILTNRRLALSAALEAARLDVRMDTFGIGKDAIDAPDTLLEMAQVSSGVFTPVVEPRDLRPIFENVNFSGIDAVRVQNLTTAAEANYLRRDADGSFSALVPMAEGENTLEVYARAVDGSEGRRKLRFNFSREGGVGELSERLRGARNRLLEDRLADLRSETAKRTAAANEQLRRELLVRIEAARARATARSRAVRIEQAGDGTPGATSPPAAPSGAGPAGVSSGSGSPPPRPAVPVLGR